MAALVKALGLYDLLAPQFLAGFQFPDYIDKYLSVLAVADLQSTSDANSVLYTGTVFFPSSPGSPPVLQHREPSGRVFEIKDLTLQFRLLVPRAGSGPIKTVVDTLATAPQLKPIKDIFDSLGAQTATPTDYPGIAFQLELLLSGLQFHLGDNWKPGKMGSDFFIAIDPDAKSDDVRIVLPKVLMRYQQGQDFTTGTSFKLASWGNPGYDAPNDFSEGELATMDPPLAVKKSLRWGLAIDEIVVDLSDNGTPPEILDHFGEDESFEGVYVKLLQVYYADDDKDTAINFALRDALISFDGDFSFEAELDLVLDTQFSVDVRIYDGKNKVSFTTGTDGSPKGVFTGGKATIPGSAVIYLQVTGGIPSFTYSVAFTPDGGGEQQLWSDVQRQAKFASPPTSSQHGTLVIQVTDAAAVPHSYKNTLDLTVTAAAAPAADTPADTTAAAATFTPDAAAPPPAGTADDNIQFAASAPGSGTSEILKIVGGSTLPTVTVGGSPYALGDDRQVIVDVQPGASIPVEVDFPGSEPGNEFRLLFKFEEPSSDALTSTYLDPASPPSTDPIFAGNRVPDDVAGGAGHLGADALRYWVQNALDLSQPITIAGLASNEGKDGNDQSNLLLSKRRADIAASVVGGVAGASVSAHDGLGVANSAASLPTDRVARISGTAKTVAPYKLTGTLARATAPAQKTPPAPQAAPAPPSPPANKKPGFLRRLSLRTRFEHNVPVLAEISGEVDFETDSEAALRNVTGGTDQLNLQTTAAASSKPNPGNGITDFTLTITHDTATDDYIENLKIGAAPADIDGLLRMSNAQPFSRLKDTLGAVMMFTPILNAATEAIDPNSAGDWAAIAVDLGVPAAIGALGFIHTTEATLFGGELVLRENIPNGISSTQFTNAALTFDYGVSFRIDVDALDIHSSGNMKVRYKAVGVNLHFGDPPKVQFVLDTSKGYSLDLSDPSLFNLPAPLGNLLKVAAARIARFNPLTIELDLEIKADLGVVTVDKFQVKIPLDGASSPMILPSGVKVNIPSAIIGSGSVKIDSGGFEGTIDVTLVPLKLRMAASIGVEHISQPPREATAFFLGLELDFPAPIILGSSGLGLFGLFGLFGLNYARVLDPANPGDPVGPDLRWLMKTGGAPYKLNNAGVQLWTPTLDSWAFGVGVLLGTVDGFLLNLRGMFILELPGPRILITVNAKIIADLPGVSDDGMDATSLDVGIIGILDIDVGANTITLGVMVALDIDQLVTIQIPIQIFFDENDTSNWHVWIGTIQSPATAKVLGIVRGAGYFMAGGQAISPFPPGTTGTSLPGVAVALGVSAPIIWGSEAIDIYLKVVVSADLGISFTPHLFITGNIHVEGELRLVIVSVGASGDFTVTAPHPVYLKVHICGKVSFFFFDISACIDFATAPSAPLPPPPPALVSKMYLQSFAPVIASGQGGERPIDASLGDAVGSAASGLPGLSLLANPGPIPVVPVDSVPVAQMLYGADASTVAQTFTAPIGACPTYPGGAGVGLGGGRSARYKLRSVLLDPPLPGGELPPAVWRPNKPSADTSQTQVDLALFSRNPNVTNSALERSTELSDLLISIWGDTCTQVAPPACVFWAFCGQRLGPSPDGWTLFGTPLPDPPNTQRTSPVPTEMQVEQPSFSGPDKLLMDLSLQLIGEGIQPAQVVGPGSIVQHAATRIVVGRSCFRAVELPELLTAAFGTKLASELNPDQAAKTLSKLKDEVQNSRWLRYHTGLSQRVRLLMGIDPNLFKTSQGTAKSWFLIRERDINGALVLETPLVTMNPTLVAAVSNLPATWIATGSPWGLAATQVFSLLSSLKLAVVLLEFKPQAATTTIEVAVTAPTSRIPTLLVGAVESCPQSETNRFQNGVQIQQSTIQTIEGYLDGGTPVPLLQKDTLYTLTLNYDVTVTEQGGSTNDFNGVTQAWQFRTDNKPPAKLDPWVLCTSPDMNEQHVFYDDPVDIVFNDTSILQLFAQYGFQLQMDLRAADGLPEPSGAPVTTVAVNGVGTASYDALQELIAEGKLPCVGATLAYQNQVFTAPVELRPTMGYTLDLVTSPSLTPLPDPNTPVTPLFRRTFATSKYPTMKALADDLGASRVSHRALKSRLNFTSAGGKDVRPDQDIQDLFTAAGEQALPAADKNRIVIYWAPATPNGPFAPHAVLIDCTEPLWRTRPEPTFQNPIATDPSFKIVTIGPGTSLEVAEQGGSNIGTYLVSPSGTRTVAVFGASFAPPPGGTTVSLALHRPASPIYGNPDEADIIVALQMAPTAPWENDHV
jgi:large repetitive protein